MERKPTPEETKQLFNAMRSNNINFIQDFFDKNKDVDINQVKYTSTLLHEAVKCDNIQTIDTLLKLGINR